MSKHIRPLFILVIFVSLLLSACGAATPAITAPALQTTPATTPSATTPGATPAGASNAPVAALSNPALSPDVTSLLTKLMENFTANAGYGYIQATDLQADMAFSQKPFLLDVRDPSDIQQSGYIQGAVNIPLRQLLNNLDKLPAQNAKIVIYSNTGYRSGMALSALLLLGYTDVHDLAGGLSSWVHTSKLPVVTGSTPPAPQVQTANPTISDQGVFNMLNSFFTNMPDNYYQVDDLTLAKELSSSNPPTLIDMNNDSDHQQYGHIPGAQFITFNDFFNNLGKLPSQNTPIVIYAVGGGHSSIIVMGLHLLGFSNVFNLKNGIIGWKNANLPTEPGGG